MDPAQPELFRVIKLPVRVRRWWRLYKTSNKRCLYRVKPRLNDPTGKPVFGKHGVVRRATIGMNTQRCRVFLAGAWPLRRRANQCRLGRALGGFRGHGQRGECGEVVWMRSGEGVSTCSDVRPLTREILEFKFDPQTRVARGVAVLVTVFDLVLIVIQQKQLIANALPHAPHFYAFAAWAKPHPPLEGACRGWGREQASSCLPALG